jgi:serine O-acetyltransferase
MNNEKDSDSKNISASVPDWSRESGDYFCWQPSKALIYSIRQYQKYSISRNPVGILLKKIAVFKHRFWSVVAGADIPISSQIGGGLLLPHPNGVVIHPRAIIGPNCLIFQQVTIGMSGGGVPTIGGQVDIGAGAKLLGKIVIGDHARIGANAVVLNDVESGTTVVGIPARPVSRSNTDAVTE